MRFDSWERGALVIKNIQVQNGRAEVELSLPPIFCENKGECFFLYLWDEKELPAFGCVIPINEEEPCIIKLLHPYLWEGAAKPYLYRLELYVGKESPEELLESRFLALRTLQEIPQKGWLLNGECFVPRCVVYEGIGRAGGMEAPAFWQAITRKLHNLVRMGANVLLLGSVEGMSTEEYLTLQEHCDRLGLLLLTEETTQNGNTVKIQGCVWTDYLHDTCVSGCMLLDEGGLPTALYYQYKARWSREPFVYIDGDSFGRQTDGSCYIKVYSNCRKVALMVNGALFEFQEDGPEFLFQDIRIKSFPVCFSAEAGECSMSVNCYTIHSK